MLQQNVSKNQMINNKIISVQFFQNNETTDI